MADRTQKITFADMRHMGVRGVQVYVLETITPPSS